MEYDISESGVDDLRILSSDRIEQSGLPTAMMWYPALTKESFILLANSQVGDLNDDWKNSAHVMHSQVHPHVCTYTHTLFAYLNTVQVEAAQLDHKDV